jgi:Polyketide cyclase / dehydrase and lipid transport
MPQYTDSVEIGSPAARVWEVLATPERWSEGYLETRLRSPDYPNPDSRNDHVYRTRIKEDVAARVIRSEPPRLLEEAQRGRTFSRRVRYRLGPAGERTRVTVEDEISFLGLARLAARSPPVTCGGAGGARSSGYGRPRSGVSGLAGGASVISKAAPGTKRT